MKINRKIKRRLKSDRDIGRKAVLSDVKKAFTCTPALSSLLAQSAVKLNPILVALQKFSKIQKWPQIKIHLEDLIKRNIH